MDPAAVARAGAVVAGEVSEDINPPLLTAGDRLPGRAGQIGLLRPETVVVIPFSVENEPFIENVEAPSWRDHRGWKPLRPRKEFPLSPSLPFTGCTGDFH